MNLHVAPTQMAPLFYQFCYTQQKPQYFHALDYLLSAGACQLKARDVSMCRGVRVFGLMIASSPQHQPFSWVSYASDFDRQSGFHKASVSNGPSINESITRSTLAKSGSRARTIMVYRYHLNSVSNLSRLAPSRSCIIFHPLSDSSSALRR